MGCLKEKEREISMKRLRKSQRKYNGPPLILESAKKAENDRLDALQKKYSTGPLPDDPESEKWPTSNTWAGPIENLKKCMRNQKWI